jgi:hypothetical protein
MYIRKHVVFNYLLAQIIRVNFSFLVFKGEDCTTNEMKHEIEVLVVKMAMLVFWDVTPCGLVGRHQP